MLLYILYWTQWLNGDWLEYIYFVDIILIIIVIIIIIFTFTFGRYILKEIEKNRKYYYYYLYPGYQGSWEILEKN